MRFPTRDKVEKKFGVKSQGKIERINWREALAYFKNTTNKKGEDRRGKFTLALGDFVTDSGRMVTDILVEEGHAVAYFGGSKEEIQDKHMANRKKLIREGHINMSSQEAGLE